MTRLLINCYSNKFYQLVGTSFMHSRFVTLNHISNLTVKGFQISWNAFRQKVFHNVVGVLIMPAQQLALCQHFVLRIFMSLYYPNLCSFYLVMRRITEKKYVNVGFNRVYNLYVHFQRRFRNPLYFSLPKNYSITSHSTIRRLNTS